MISRMLGADSPQIQALLSPSRDTLDALERNVKVLRSELESLSASASQEEREEITFALAAALVSHVDLSFVSEGLELMEILVFQRMGAARGAEAGAALSSENAHILAMYYYYIAIAWVKRGDMQRARGSITRMLELEPANPQGLGLKEHISANIAADGVTGIAAAAAVGVGVLAGIFALAKGRR